MKILSWEPKRWRIEYQDDFNVVVGGLDRWWHPRRWRIYHEDIRESIAVRSWENFALMDIDIPVVWDLVNFVMKHKHDSVELHPYEPVKVAQEIYDTLGPRVVERIEQKDRNCKLWHLENGYVWLHMPGDAAR